MTLTSFSEDRRLSLNKLRECIKAKHHANVLMPGRNAKHPNGQSFKGPMHGHKDGKWTWDRADKENWSGAEMIGLLLKDLIVADLDGPTFIDEYEAAFPCLKSCPKEATRKGAHYFFERTPLCDELGIYDCARGLKNDKLPAEADGVLPLDIKTICSTGTCGFLVVTPSRDKSWVQGREPWTIPIRPIPDEFVHAIAEMRIKKPGEKVRRVKKENDTESCASSRVVDDDAFQDVVGDARYAPAWEEFAKLVRGLNIKRHVAPHTYPLWSQLGWAMTNVGRTGKYVKKARDLFDEISKESTEYCEESVQEVLENARTNGAQLGFRYILDVLKEDNPQLYREYTMNSRPTTNDPLEKAIYQSLEFPTNSNVANVFVVKHGKDFVWLSGGKNFYWFNGTFWKLQRDLPVAWNLFTSSLSASFEKAKLEAQSTLDVADNSKETLMTKYRDNAMVILGHLGDTVKTRQIFAQIAMRLSDPDIVDRFDKNRDLLCFTDKVVDLRTKEVRNGRHEDYLTISTGYPYPTSDGSTVPDFLEYFKQVLPDDEERRYFLDQQAQRLSGHLHGQTFHLYTGSGSNGKSLTFQSLLKPVWGKYYQTLPVQVITSKRSAPGQATPELARVGNCRRLVCVEPEEDAKINVSLIKQLSGGDEQEVRALYGDMVNFEPQFKVDLLCNKMIAIDGSDTGAKRRVRAQHWPSKFTFDVKEPNYETNEYPAERTEVMTAKFAEWRDDLALFFINRYQPEYVENAPLNIKKFTDEYMDENNIYAHFCQRYVRKTDDRKDFFRIKDAKEKWFEFSSYMVETGNSVSRPRMPKEIDLKDGLSTFLKAPCQKKAKPHLSEDNKCSVFIGFTLIEPNASQFMPEDD
jgi:phage/plasmid-associated DNA primase